MWQPQTSLHAFSSVHKKDPTEAAGARTELTPLLTTTMTYRRISQVQESASCDSGLQEPMVSLFTECISLILLENQAIRI